MGKHARLAAVQFGRVLLVLLVAAFCWAPTVAQNTQIQNDCLIQFGISGGFALTGAGQAVQFQNIRYGCFDWRVVYFVDGFSAISLVAQSAPDNAGVPGSWSTFAGTVIDGVNPNTSTTFAATRLTGAPPWVRVLLNTASGAGSVSGVMYGCKQPGCSSAELTTGSITTPCAGTVGTPCIVAGPDAPGAVSTKSPVQVAGNDGTDVRAIKTDASGNTDAVGPDAAGAASTTNPVQVAGNDGTDVRAIRTDAAGDTRSVGGAPVGSTAKDPVTTGAQSSGLNALADYFCDQTAPITIAGSGLTQIVALSSGKSIRICHIDFALSASSNFTIQNGTGSNCGTGTGSLTGTYPAVLTFADDFGPRASLVAPASNAVCLNVVSSVTGGGLVTYALF